jgi:hypothetical protein
MKIKSTILLLFVFSLIIISSIKAQDFTEIEKTFQLDKDGKVVIDTYKGEIIIEIWDKPEVHVYAKIIPDDSNGFGGTSPKKQLSCAKVEFDSSPNSVRIESIYKKNISWFGNETRAFVNYRIQMPKTALLKISDYKSETNISGLQSSLNLETYKGEVKIIDFSGTIELTTYKGEIDVNFIKLSGNSSFETYKGEISVSLPKSSAFSIDGDFSKKADFHSTFDIDKDSYEHGHDDYNIRKDINGGGPTINLSSEKGKIELLEK